MRQRKADPVEHQSSHPLHERIEQLKQLFPEAVNEDGIDADMLVNLLGKRQERKERYNFTWAGKQDAVLSLGRRSQAALKPVPDESLNWDCTGHLFIEGDNLEALKLLHKSYFGRVKMIYIDPPYNTGKDFVYPDNYAEPLDNYLRLTGQVDEDGAVQTTEADKSGRWHSNWLSMMYPRLFLARQLLREDGVIFVSIDDNEVHNLRMIMNQIFGEENFVATVIWEKKYSPQNDARWFSDNHDYVLVYARNKENWRPNLLPRTAEADARYTNPDNDPRGNWKSSGLDVKTYLSAYDYPITTPSGRVVYPPKGRCWRTGKDNFLELVQDNRIWFGKSGNNVPSIKRFLSEVKNGITPLTIWTRKEVGDSQSAIRVIRTLFDDTSVFNTPKAVGLIRRMIHLSTDANSSDIILDFFAGSATTAQAVLEQNREDGGSRKFIMVQLPEPMSHEQFDTIADVGKERIRRVIKRMKSESASQLDGFGQPNEDLGFRVFRLDKSSMRQWQDLPSETSADDYVKQMKLFVADPLLDGWTASDVIAEVAVKEAGFSLTYRVEQVQAVTEQTVCQVIDDEKEQRFYICLDKVISFDALKPLRLTPDDLFVFRDRAIDDTIVANLALACRIKSI